MAQILNTTLYWRYEVSSPEACSVTLADGSLLCSVAPGAPAEFVGDGRPVTLSSDAARMLPVAGRLVQQGGGGASPALSATGEPVLPLAGDALVVQHATWFVNDAQGSITVQPGVWRNEVMTCYLKTSVPVSLTGVTWLYGEPFMADRYIYVIALQQLDAISVFANLAYTIPQ